MHDQQRRFSHVTLMMRLCFCLGKPKAKIVLLILIHNAGGNASMSIRFGSRDELSVAKADSQE